MYPHKTDQVKNTRNIEAERRNMKTKKNTRTIAYQQQQRMRDTQRMHGYRAYRAKKWQELRTRICQRACICSWKKHLVFHLNFMESVPGFACIRGYINDKHLISHAILLFLLLLLLLLFFFCCAFVHWSAQLNVFSTQCTLLRNKELINYDLLLASGWTIYLNGYEAAK